jgi:hypothetical protein
MMENPSETTFTVGIHDDVTNLSIDYDPSFSVESADTFAGTDLVLMVRLL